MAATGIFSIEFKTRQFNLTLYYHVHIHKIYI
jgi:hypothetical protein